MFERNGVMTVEMENVAVAVAVTPPAVLGGAIVITGPRVQFDPGEVRMILLRKPPGEPRTAVAVGSVVQAPPVNVTVGGDV
jgi:hypothetical protein